MADGKTNIPGMIGFWAFIVGLIIAVVVGIMVTFTPAMADAVVPIVMIILLILGLLIGFLNITGGETLLFLVATVAIIVVGSVFGALKTFGIGALLDNILSLIATLMAPAAIVVAIKALWKVGKPGN